MSPKYIVSNIKIRHIIILFIMTEGRKDYMKEKDFERLFKEKYSVLFCFATNIIGDQEEAKDIVGDCFEYVWQHWDNFEPKALSTFMFRFVRNRCIDKTRHFSVEEQYRKNILSEALSYNESAEDDVAEKMKRVNRTIEAMPPQMRKVFEACFLEKKSYKEASAEFGVSINTIKSHIRKALQMLRSNKYALLITLLTLIGTFLGIFILSFHLI